MIERRSFITGLIALVAAPAIVRAGSLMPVKIIDIYDTRCIWHYCIGSDEMILRIDRALHTLARPQRITEIPLKVAKQIFGFEHPIFDLMPEARQQKFVSKAIPSHELIAHGFLPSWPNVQSRFFANYA